MAQEPQLTFETFIGSQDDTAIPYFDNFPLFFAKGDLAEYYRTLRPYKELKREVPDLEGRLREGISRLNSLNQKSLKLFYEDLKSLKLFYEDLYSAYLIMRKYVTSDTELGLPPMLTRH